MRSAKRSAAAGAVARWLAATVLLAAWACLPVAQAQMADAGRTQVESIKNEIERIEMSSDSELDAETKKKITDYYKSALVALQRLSDLDASDAQLRQQLQEVTQTAKRLAEERLAVLRAPREEIRGRTPAELEVELAARTANVALLKQELKDLENRREKRSARQLEIRQIQDQADARRAELRRQVEAPPPAGEPVELTEARRLDARLRLDAFARSLPVLELELALAVAEEQAEILRLEAELRKAKLTREEAAVDRLTKMINELRQKEAQKQLNQTRQQSAQTHPLLAPLAEQNRKDAELAARYPGKIQKVKDDSESIRREMELQEEKFRDIKEKERLVGLTQPIGAQLRIQRSQFPDLPVLERQLKRRVETLEQARLASWRYADELASLPTPAEYVSSVFPEPDGQQAQDPAAAELSAEHRRHLEEQAADLLATRRELLSSLKRATEDYAQALYNLDFTDRRYLQESRDYLHYINERILWTRSADPLSIARVRDDVASRAWLLSPTNWQSVLQAGMDDPVKNPFAFWPTLLTVLALFYVRLSIRPRLRALGGIAGKRGFLRYGPTAQAAVMTVMAAVTAPAALMFISWRLAEADDPTGFVSAVATALQVCAAVLLPTELLREACRHQGLAEAHFAWPPRAVQHLRRVLTWMKPVGLPVTFFAVLAHEQQPLSGGTPLERLLFIGAMALVAVTMHRLLHRSGDLVMAFQAERPKSLFTRFHRLWYFVGVALPIVFAGLSALGYHYSATQVAGRLLWTLWLAVGLMLVRAMAVRWIVLSRRRLLLDQAYQRRAAEETQENAGTLLPPVIEETDVATTTAQTRKLVDIVVLGFAVSFLGMIWADTLPAFGLLDRELWNVERTVSVAPAPASGDSASTSGAPAIATAEAAATEQSGVVSITTLDVAVAILVAIFTLLASKNLPGLMEMSVLNRLPLDNATRYAATRLASYVIIFLGVMMASNRLGLRWQNIQWLAAALTVGLGFGLQEVFANFVSGLIILFERPIRVGDIVTIDGTTGLVSRIRMRATTITDWDRKEFIVPNKEFITGRVLNWTLTDAVNRITVNVGIAFGSDVELATKILLRICHEHPVLLKEPEPNVCFEGFGDSTLSLVLRCFMPSYDGRLDVIHQLHTRINDEFNRAGIEIAFPQRDLHIRSIDGLTLPLPVAESKPDRDRERAAG